MDLFELIGKIVINNDEADSAIDSTKDKASSMADSIQGKFENVGNKVTAVGKKFIGASTVITGAGAAMVGLATKTASTTDNIDKMSQKLGISRTAYQEWDYILSQNGTSIDTLKTGMKTLTTTLDTVQETGTTAKTAFERLGISYEQLSKMSPEETFEETIKALQNCQDKTERTTLATKLFGKAGVELAPLLNAGAESTEELKKRAHELGMVLDDDVINAGVNMTDAMDTMKRAMSAVGSEIALAVMPYITDFCYFIAEHIPVVKDTIASLIEKFHSLPEPVQKIIEITVTALGVAAPVLMVLGNVISGLGTFITVLGAVLNPVTLVIGIVGGLVAALVTLYNTNETVRNVINTVWNAIKSIFTSAVAAIKSVVTSGFHAIQSTVSSVSNAIKNVFTTAWNGIKSVSTSAISAVKSAVTSGMNAVQSSVSSVLNGIKSKFTEIWNNCTSVVSGAISKIKGLTNFSWSLPHLALPHFSISGSFSLNPPSVPHLGVEWYAKAMNEPYLFTDPTLFGYNPATGASRGAGEAGDEMMYGKKNLMNDIGTVVSAENKEIAIRLDQIARMLSAFFANNSNMQLVLDTGVLVGETAPMMNKELSKIAIQKGRGR